MIKNILAYGVFLAQTCPKAQYISVFTDDLSSPLQHIRPSQKTLSQTQHSTVYNITTACCTVYSTPLTITAGHCTTSLLTAVQGTPLLLTAVQYSVQHHYSLPYSVLYTPYYNCWTITSHCFTVQAPHYSIQCTTLTTQ